jgi:superfamily II DNA/RNA helicase
LPARAGKEGISVTLVDWKDLPRWKLVNSALGMDLAEPAETYSTSEHLYEALDIPTDVTGTLPKAQRGRAGLEAEEVEDIGETGRTRSQHAEPRSRRPRERNRTRKRTRGGRPLEAGEDAVPTAPAMDSAEPETPAERPARRRTRTRRSAETTAPQASESQPTESQPIEPKATEPEPEAQAQAQAPEPKVIQTQAPEPKTAPPRVEAPTSSTPAGVPIVEFMAPPANPDAESLHQSDPTPSTPRRRRRTRSAHKPA